MSRLDRISLRVTEVEFNAIEKKSKISNKSKSDYIRDLIYFDLQKDDFNVVEEVRRQKIYSAKVWLSSIFKNVRFFSATDKYHTLITSLEQIKIDKPKEYENYNIMKEMKPMLDAKIWEVEAFLFNHEKSKKNFKVGVKRG